MKSVFSSPTKPMLKQYFKTVHLEGHVGLFRAHVWVMAILTNPGRVCMCMCVAETSKSILWDSIDYLLDNLLEYKYIQLRAQVFK